MNHEKFFAKTHQNNMFKAIKEQSISKRYSTNRLKPVTKKDYIFCDPAEVIIMNVEQNKLYEIPVRVYNISSESKKIIIKPPKNNFFKIDYERRNKNNQIAPGLYLELLVIFEAEAQEDYFDKVEICSGEQYTITLELKAQKSKPHVLFEPFINFGFVPVNSKRSAKVAFFNEGPKATDIELKFTNAEAADILQLSNSKFHLTGLNKEIKGKKNNNKYEVVIVYDPRESSKNLNETVEVIQSWNNSIIGTIELIATSVVQQLAIVFEEGGGPQTEINFGSLFYGQLRESSAFLVNNGSKEVFYRMIFHPDKRPKELQGNLDDSDFICSPIEAGKEIVERILSVNPISGLIKPYSQIPLQFSCSTKIPDINKGFRGHMCDFNEGLKEKYPNLEYYPNSLQLKSHCSTIAIKFKEPKDENIKGFNYDDNTLMCETLSVFMQAKTMLPEITLDKTMLNFWECNIHEQKATTIKITNKNEDLTVDFKFSKIPHFTVEPSNGTIRPNGHFIIITVTFHPENFGKFEDTIVLKYVKDMYDYKISVMGFCKNPVGQIKSARPERIRGPDATLKNFKSEKIFLDDKEVMNYTLPKLGFQDKRDRLKSREKRIYEDRIVEMEKNLCNNEIIDNFKKQYEIYKHLEKNKNKANSTLTNFRRERTAKGLKGGIRLPSANTVNMMNNTNTGFTQDNNPLEILANQVKGDSPKMKLPKTKEQLWVTKQIGKYEPNEDNEITETKSKFVFDSNIQAKEGKVVLTPYEHKDIKECKMELNGLLLQKIEVGPKEIDFGEIFRKTTKIKTFWVRNNLKTSIHIKFDENELGDLQKSTIKSMVIKSGAVEGFNLSYYAEEPRKWHFYVKYTINYQHHFKLKIIANVIPPFLNMLNTLSGFVFNSISKEPDMVFSQVLKLQNSGNATVSYNFDQLKNDRYFYISPTQGEVKPNEIANIQFTFDPGDYKSRNEIEDETKLNVENGIPVIIKLRGSVPPSEVNLESGDTIDFKAVHQGVRVKKQFTLKNYKPGITAFKIIDIDNFVSFEPNYGIVDSKKTNIDIYFKSNINQEYIKKVKILVRGGNTLSLNIKANVIIPDVRIIQNKFDFGTASFGEEKLETLTFKNYSEIAGIIRVDLTTDQFKCFKLRLHSKYKGSKNHLISNLLKDYEEEETKNKDNENEETRPNTRKLYQDEDEIKNNLRLFEIEIPENSELDFDFIFVPSADLTNKSFNDLFTNFEIKGVTDFNPALQRKITAHQIQSKISIHPEKIEFEKTFLVKAQQNYSDTILKIFNHSEETLKWKLDISEMDVCFKINEKMGEILPQSSVDLKFKFLPEQKIKYESKFFILIQNDKEQYEKSKEVVILGEGSHPRIYFDHKELVFPIVPLGIESIIQFKIKNEGYEGTPLKWRIDSDMGVLPIKLKWIDGSNNIGVLKNELGAEISFSNVKPLSFTCKLVFLDYENEAFSILVAGTTDNCLFTNYSFISKYSEYCEMTKEKNDAIMMRLIENNNVVLKTKSSEEPYDTTSNESVSQVGTIASRSTLNPPKINKHQQTKTLSFLLNFLNNFLTTSVSHFPDSLSNIENKNELLHELILNLSGRKEIPGKMSKPSSDFNQRILQQRQSFYDTLKYLQENGAYINTIFPEYLLEYSCYKKYLKLDPTSSKLLPNNWEKTTKLLNNHKILYLDSWVLLIYQIIKVFYLVRVTTKSLPKIVSIFPEELIQDIDEKMKFPYSNIYSTSEQILLKWLKINWMNVNINPVKVKEFWNFQEHIIESGVLFNLTQNYFPKEERIITKRQKQTEQKIPTGEKIIQAFKEYGVYTHVIPDDINNGYAREIMCFCLILYQNLQNFIPRGDIEFSCILGEKVRKAILLENPYTYTTGKKIEYSIKKEGSRDFEIEDINDISLDPTEKIEFIVNYNSRISSDVRGKLYFLNKNIGFCYQSAPIVYNLVSNVIGRKSFGKTIAIKSCLYKKIEAKIPVSCPFKVKGDFSILPLEVKRKNPLPKPKNKFGFAPKKDDNKKEDLTTPTVFILKNPDIQVRLDNNDTREVSLYFCPIDLEPYVLNMVFFNEQIGEFQITVEGYAELPDYTEIIEDTCYVEEIKEVFINVKLNNKYMKSALELIYQNEYKKENQELLEKYMKFNFDKVNFSVESTKPYFIVNTPYLLEKDPLSLNNNTNSTAKSIKEEAINNNIKTENPNLKIEDKNNTILNTNYLDTKSNLNNVNANAAQPLIVKFSSKACQNFEGEIILKNQFNKITDIRVYKIVLTVKPKNIYTKMIFNCPLGQEIVQKIPVYNSSDADWLLKAEIIPSNPKQNFFSGLTDKKISKHTTDSYLLKFYPTEKIQECNAKLMLKNTFTKELYEYELKGFVDDPLAEGSLEITLNAFEEKKLILNVENPSDQEINYIVETDLTDIIRGPERISVRARNTYKYELIIQPFLGKTYFGKITFIDEKGSFKWWTIKVDAKPIVQKKTLEMKTTIRKAIYIQISLENPTNNFTIFYTNYEGPYLKGDKEIRINPKSSTVYNLLFEPFKVGKWDGMIHIFNEGAGEYLYKLKLIAEEATTVYLDTIKAELGKTETSSLILENPTDTEIVIYYTLSNPVQFRLIPDKIVIPPEAAKEILVKYTPSTLEYEEDCTAIFESMEIGRWEYKIRGRGLYPTPMPLSTISTFVGGIVSGGVSFKNPFNEKIQILVEMKCDEWPGTFRLMLKNNRVILDSYKTIFLNYSFSPTKLTKYNAELIVYISKTLFWKYPVEGITEVRSKGIDYVFKTKSKKCLENKVVIDLADVPGSVAYEDLTLFKKIKEEKYKGLVEKCLHIQIDNDVKTYNKKQQQPQINNEESIEEDLESKKDNRESLPTLILDRKITLLVKFFPLRPFKTEMELIINRKQGGQWIFNIMLEALESDFEDTIIVKSSLGRTSNLNFRLCNLFTRHASFIAYFTHDSSSEFNIYPKEGVLEPSGK